MIGNPMSVLISRENKICRITINRPEKRNALSLALCRELLGAFREAESDDAVSVVLLDAAGNSFSSGMDLGEIAEPDFIRQADVHEELLTIGSFSLWLEAAPCSNDFSRLVR